MDNKYNAYGLMFIRIGPDYNIETQIYDKEYYLRKYSQYYSKKVCYEMATLTYAQQCTRRIYDLFDGKEFLQMVKAGGITDDDGHVVDIFVDGYRSNLGLTTDNLTSSGFLVSEKVWLDICKSCKVEVNWANK